MITSVDAEAAVDNSAYIYDTNNQPSVYGKNVPQHDRGHM